MTETKRSRAEGLPARAAALDREGAAIVIGAGALVVGALVALPFFWSGPVAIEGPGSVSQVAAVVAGIVALVAYAVGRLWHREALTPFGGSPGEVPAGGRRSFTGVDLFDTVVIALAHGIVALLGWVVLGSVLARGFTDATVYAVSATVLTGAAVGVTAYAVFLSAARMDLMRLSTVLATFAIVGILAAMLSAPDPHWWMLHLSALGMTNSISSLTFNVTLIVAGLIMAAISRYATAGGGGAGPRRARLRLRCASS